MVAVRVAVAVAAMVVTVLAPVAVVTAAAREGGEGAWHGPARGSPGYIDNIFWRGAHFRHRNLWDVGSFGIQTRKHVRARARRIARTEPKGST